MVLCATRRRLKRFPHTTTTRLIAVVALAMVSGVIAGAEQGGDSAQRPGIQASSFPQAGNVPQGIVAGDFNGDGLADLAVTNAFDDTVSILLGDGLGGFSAGPVVSVDSGGGLGDDLPREIIAVDLNGNGIRDLAVINSGNPAFLNPPSVGILEVNRKGGLEAVRLPEISESGNPLASFSLAAANLNSNALPDLVAGNFSSNTVSILSNKGGFRFSGGDDFPVATSGSGPAAVLLVDLGLDGNRDLIVANSGDLATLEGDGDGTFGAANLIAGGTSWENIAVSDFNNDGEFDLAAVDSAFARVRVFLSLDESGSFTSIVDTTLPFAGAVDLVAEDFNQDGFMDLAIAFIDDDRLGIFTGNGDGSFVQASLFTTGREPRAITVDDLNFDGRPDLATANEGDQFFPANEDVTVVMNSLPEASAFEASAMTPLDDAAPLGVGIARVAGAGWHAARNSLYVVVPDEPSIVELSTLGVRLLTIDSTTFGSFDPSEVTVEPSSGDLFVTDRLESKVFRLTATGALVSSFSTAAAGADYPSSITYDSIAGRLLIGNETSKSVYAFSLSGVFQKVFQGDNPYSDLAFDSSTGLLWATEFGEDSVELYTLDDVGNELVDFDETNLEDIADLLDEQDLDGLALDVAGGRVFLIGPRGLLVEASIGGTASSSIELGLGTGFRAADVDPATGDVWLLDSGLTGTVLCRTESAGFSARFQVQDHATADAFTPRSLAWGDGSIFVAGNRSDEVLRFSPTGVLQDTTSLSGLVNGTILGLEYDEDTDLLLILTQGRLYEVDLSPSLVASYPITLARDFTDMSLDMSGGQIALYTALRAEIWLVDRQGEFMGRAAAPPSLPYRFSSGAGSFSGSGAGAHLIGDATGGIIRDLLITPAGVPSAVHHWIYYE